MSTSLSPRDRILKTLAFEETDIVPYHVMIDKDVHQCLAVYLGDDGFDRCITNHLPFYNLEPKIEWTSDQTYVDAFGCGWRMGNAPHLERPALLEPDLKDYTFPDLGTAEYFQGIGEFLSQYDRHFTFCGIAHGFFDRGWALRGMENFLIDFMDHPAFIEELLETLTDIYLDLIDRIARYSFDGIRFGDDWGHQRGVLIGADRWRKFVKPGLKKIFSYARARGLAVMVHSDGDVSELIPDLIEMGVQILNPLQPEAMNILEIKRAYGKELCLNGGISTQFTLPLGSTQDVRRETAACLQLLGAGGGYVAGPAKAIMRDVPLANAAALIDALVNQPVAPEQEANPQPAAALWRVYAAFHPQKRSNQKLLRK
jgi:uroporphyrinogen decarboxylase